MGDREESYSNIIVQKSCQARHSRELAAVLPGSQEYRGRLEGEGGGGSPNSGIAPFPLLMGVANAAQKDHATRFGSHIISSLSLEATYRKLESTFFHLKRKKALILFTEVSLLGGYPSKAILTCESAVVYCKEILGGEWEGNWDVAIPWVFLLLQSSHALRQRFLLTLPAQTQRLSGPRSHS